VPPTLSPTPTRIRRLFLDAKPTYTLAEAAELLGMRRRVVRGWMEVGELEGVETTDGVVLPWGELVSFAMGFWEPEEIEAALGAELAEAIPELLQLTDLEVRLPRMEVVALERVAAREGRSVSAVLSRELLDFVSAHAEWLSKVVPGFAAAFEWPPAVRAEC
jgi:hypothetical protein